MIYYQQVLADVEARRATIVADIDASIRTVKHILQTGSQQAQSRPRVGMVGNENQSKIVLDFLIRESPKSFNSKAVAEATGLGEKGVRSILNRLSKGKRPKLERPTRGKYRAKPQARDATTTAAA